MKRAAEMSANHMDSNIDDAAADLSILRRPIKTSTSGLNEARKAYENGTDEVRQLLTNECDLIYECKVCRNVFRSLVNFISHKRIYCKNTFNSSVHFNFHNDGQSGYNQDLATIVQAEKDFISASKSGRSQEKDLSSIVERLVKRERVNQTLKLSDFYEQVSSKLTQDEILQKKHVLQLDTVPESNVAVYQTIKTDSCDSIKTEISEINDLLDTDNTVLGPDGKILAASAGDGEDNENAFVCEICKNQFATQKTLKLHIETKHIPSTYVYQCPSCCKTFLQVKAVIRHLTNDHKKSMKRVRLMRDSILKRRTRIDEVQVKGPSRELARLQTCQEKADAQNKAWLENLENIDASVSVNVCTFCGKRFDRRVVLLSHSKVCQQKYKSTEAISLTKKAVDEENGSIDTDSIETNVGYWPSTILDESSNSNSIDTETCLRQSSTVNKRKRNRTIKANMRAKLVETDDDNADQEFVEEVEKNDKPADMELDVFDGGNNANTTTWNIIDPETKINICTIKEIKLESVTPLTKSINGEKGREKEASSSNCKYCNKNFSNPSNLRRHITMLHVRQRKFGCLLCREFRAFRRTDVIQHIHTVHEFAGKKASIAEYISEKEVITSNIQPTQNRRKDKHTAVLKDDEVQVILESDDMETSNSVPFPEAVNDSSNIQSIENSSNTENLIKENATSDLHNIIKRKGRPKNIVKRRLSQKVERSVSADTNVTRRPVRNRTMPVKKDFVYDLSNLLKKDAALYSFKEHHPPPGESQEKQHSVVTRSRNVSPSPINDKQQQKKRRNTIQGNTSVVESEKQNGTEGIKAASKVCKCDNSGTASVKGAADAMATLAVNNNRAIFSKPPRLPTERQLSRTIKHKSVRSFDSIAIRNWPILKRPMRAGLKSKANSLNATVNNFRHVLKRKKNYPSVNRPLVTGNRPGGEEALKLNGSDTTVEDETPGKIIKISTKIADKIQMKYAENVHGHLKKNEAEIESIKERDQVPKFAESEPPKRRMTLLERLAENKTKKMKESMSTMKNILKQDNDSDENSD